MRYLADSRQMKSIDNHSIDVLGIPSMVLMERAALSVAEHIRQEFPKPEQVNKIIAVCGTGNNGGDGLAIARILHLWGYNVAYFLVGNPEKATKETCLQLEILKNLGVEQCVDLDALNLADILVDAIFGIGLIREVTGIFADVICAMNASKAKTYAVDIPSGIHSDNGQVMGCAVKAHCTVTFGVLKVGLALYPGAEYAGEIFVEDIGFPQVAVENAQLHVYAFEKDDISVYLPKRVAHSNKGSYGKVLIIAGSAQMGGAAVLSATAAYRMGVGLVRVFTVQENRDVILKHLPEAILTLYDENNPDLDQLLKAMDWADAICIGPGLSTADYAKKITAYVCKNCSVPLIMDADALNIVAMDDSLLTLCHAPVILTPHLGEMSRLCGQNIKDIQKDLINVCMEYANRNSIICAMKDARTIISDGKIAYINIAGNNGMATGGSGDVLSGIIAGLLAQNVEPLTAAALGCYIHGCAGDQACIDKGEYGLLASDIIQYMLKVL